MPNDPTPALRELSEPTDTQRLDWLHAYLAANAQQPHGADAMIYGGDTIRLEYGAWGVDYVTGRTFGNLATEDASLRTVIDIAMRESGWTPPAFPAAIAADMDDANAQEFEQP